MFLGDSAKSLVISSVQHSLTFNGKFRDIIEITVFTRSHGKLRNEYRIYCDRLQCRQLGHFLHVSVKSCSL